LSVAPLKLPFLTEELVRTTSQSLEEPGWLLDDRLAALELVARLPAESNQLFTSYLDLRAVHFDEISPYLPAELDAGPPDAPDVEEASALIHVRDGRVVERVLSDEAQRASVFLGTFGELLRERPEILRSIIGGGASLPADDAFGQVARAGFAVGVALHVPEGVTLTRPIVIRWSAVQPGRGLISRTVVSLGNDAHATLLEEQLPGDAVAADDTPQNLWWGTSEVHLGENATLDVSAIQDFSRRTIAIVNRDARMDREAKLRWSLASVGSLLHKSRIDNRLEGRGSAVHQTEVGFGAGSQHFDLTSYTRHVGQDTTGDLLSKGVFLDRSRGYIKGLIQINQTARGTDSFLGEFSMLLDRKARSVTIPSLEIDQPDVRRAAHSSSAGPIDESQVFYLMSRGIDRETARKFIVLGFLEPVVSRVPLAGAQEHLRDLLEQKWPAVASPAASAPAA
jgi:Fe-S cluster assembly scaffold protein SufB